MVVTPYSNTTEGKKEQVEKMFNEIAHRYDFINQLLSFGIHKFWRRKTIRLLSTTLSTKNSILLDVATGTADFAIDSLLLNPEKIIGIDIANDMLAVGKNKLINKNLSEKIELIQANSEELPFADNFFDAATVGFGVRNFENLEKGLLEVSRTLKKGSSFAILEFSIPERFPMKQLYNMYLKYICPFLGRLISKNPVAYNYLFESVEKFPHGEKLNAILLKSGFSSAVAYPQTFGIVTIYIAKK